MYAEKTRALLTAGVGSTQRLTRQELARQHVDAWANSVWAVERILKDPVPGKAAAAATEAAAPYVAAYKEYQAAEASYDAASQGYAQRAASNEVSASQLKSYADEHRLLDNSSSVETYEQEAELLQRQAKALEGFAGDYAATAKRLRGALPVVQQMAAAAARYAAWWENPRGVPGPERVYTFTVAPPTAPAPAPVEPLGPVVLAP